MLAVVFGVMFLLIGIHYYRKHYEDEFWAFWFYIGVAAIIGGIIY